MVNLARIILFPDHTPGRKYDSFIDDGTFPTETIFIIGAIVEIPKVSVPNPIVHIFRPCGFVYLLCKSFVSVCVHLTMNAF